MNITTLTEQFSVSEQITPADVAQLAEAGVQTIVCNRPDGEEAAQATMDEVRQAAQEANIAFVEIAFTAGQADASHEQALAATIATGQKIHAYCRTGTRSQKLWQQVQDNNLPPLNHMASASESSEAILSADQQSNDLNQSTESNTSHYDIVIIGAGSAGIATAASLRKRNKQVNIALIDPAQEHYYQPGWTMVGGGVFDAESTQRPMAKLIPAGCTWLKQAVDSFLPIDNKVQLDNGDLVSYQHLVVAPGLKLDWDGVEGLQDALGKNGVTSNYRYDLAPYTWKLVQNMDQGKAIFTQPPMPIKCAGAPQKALYLSASQWLKDGKLNNIDIEFYNSGAALFGVADYVPALMEYIKKYDAKLCFTQTLIKVDGDKQIAWFKDADGNVTETSFDFLHVCPPQTSPDFIKQSELSDDAGWLDVDPNTLMSKRFNNIWGVGDVMNTTNAKTMAAARKQAPVVAYNIAASLANATTMASYDGYGSCPLTVEHGKIVLAEFGYGGKVIPTFPSWLNKGTSPTAQAWFLKANILPWIYWNAMLKGREWLSSPKT